MADMLMIRLADIGDAEAIRKLTLHAYAKWVPITPRKPRPMTVNYALSVRENRFDLLYDGETLIGLIETCRKDEELLIVSVAIDPPHQRRGLGTRLMKHAEQVASMTGLHGTRLYTNKLMTDNIRLYERLGYQVEKETHHDAGTVAVHMVRPIGEI